jgi:hypothetical protein
MKLKILFLMLICFNCHAENIIKKITTVEFDDYMQLRTYFNEKVIYIVELPDVSGDCNIGFKIEGFYILTTKYNFNNLLNGSTRNEWQVRSQMNIDCYSIIYIYSVLIEDYIKFNVLENREGKWRLAFTFIIKIKDIL